MNWRDIYIALNQKVNSLKIDSYTARNCRELLSIIEKVYRYDWHDCYNLIRGLNNDRYPGWQGQPLLSHLRYMCNNILELNTNISELLVAIAFGNSRDETRINPVKFAITVKRQMSDEVFFELCKIAFYEGKFNKEDLKSLVEELDNKELITLFLDIDISKRPKWEEQDYSDHRYRYNPYFKKTVSYSYNKYIAELLQRHLSYKEQYNFVFERSIFNRKKESIENWGLSYYLIKRLE